MRDYGTGSWEGGDPECDHLGEPFRTKAAINANCGTGTDRKNTEGRQPMGQTCSKCGATRTDQQLGLEPTPEAYVAAMVEVFREVRRVLRADGTCWLNLGDSYAGGGQAQPQTKDVLPPSLADGPKEGMHGDLFTKARAGNVRVPGLKPKDLVGIPWRVAFALQQPYYTGRIKDECDRIWLAAMVDAEGCIHIHRRKAGTNAHSTYERTDGSKAEYVRKNDTYGVMVTIDNTSKAIIDRCHAIVGRGSQYVDPANSGVQQRKQALYRWTVTGNQARELLRELYPHLVAKQREARIAYSSPKNGEAATRAHEAIKDLHNGRSTDVDAAEPPTLFEPGWYLRSDVIWGKPNPMPESVTDRPTKSHEYVFLLTKSPRYFFDQEAVREPSDAVGPSWADRKAAGEVMRHGLDGAAANGSGGYGAAPGGRNVRSVWEIATQPYSEAHFATFPEALVERCVKAGTSERGCCPECGAPWVRETEKPQPPVEMRKREGVKMDYHSRATGGGQKLQDWYDAHPAQTTGWKPTCIGADGTHGCESPFPVPCTVLDPFMGSGTTALVARRLGRRSIGIELNESYAALAAKRLQQLSLFAGEATA